MSDSTPAASMAYNISPPRGREHHDLATSPPNGSSQQMTLRKDEEQTTLNPMYKPRAFVVELLLSPDMDIVSALSEVGLINEDGSSALAEALIDFFDYHGKLKRLMNFTIQKEINKCTSGSTLFRSSSEAIKLMSVLYNRIGYDYLQDIVGSLIRDVKALDPQELKESVLQPKKVLGIVGDFLQRLFASAETCNPFIRHVLSTVRKEVNRKFTDSGSLMIGSFFCSRYLIPAIVSPVQYGLCNEAPTMEMQRVLILCSKLVQNLCNGIEFDDSKEENTGDLNLFINENMKNMHKFFEKLVQVNKDECPEKIFNLTTEDEQNAINVIIKNMQDLKLRIHGLLVKPDSKINFLKIVSADLFLKQTKPSKKEKGKNPTDERIEKLEQALEEEIRARKALEKKLNDILSFMSEQRDVNEKQRRFIEEIKLERSQSSEMVSSISDS